jgi:DNA repair exonuclease SbcCD nuclease subunit
MFKFIHTADIHLDSPLKGLEAHDDAPVDEIRGASRRAFDNLIDLALEEAVDFVLIAGDLYDGDWKDYNTGLFFAGRMGRLSDAGIRVFIVSGNHDAAGRITRTMPLPETVTLFPTKKAKSVPLDDLGVVVHGRSYASPTVTENLAARYPRPEAGYFNIGLLHTALTGRSGHAPYAPCTLDDLYTKGYDYWALGHIHKREIVSENPWVVFPGNIQGRHIRETGPRGATLVTVEEDRIIAVEERELDVLRWNECRVDLSSCNTPDSVYEQVREAFEQEREQADGRPLALRLILTGPSPVHARLMERTAGWTEEFRGIAEAIGSIWLEKVQFDTRRAISIGEMFDRNTPLAGLVQSIEQLELDNDTLLEFVPELSDLKRKLPAEIYHDDDNPFAESGQSSMNALRTQVRELLMARLLQHESSTCG